MRLVVNGGDEMDIKILGTGCAKCKAVEKEVREVVAELGVDADIEDVKDMARIMTYKVMMTPGLVIDGKVVSYGRIPPKDELTSMIATALSAEE